MATEQEFREGKRTELEIMVQILELLKEPRGVTQIMYKINLNYNQLKKYLSSMTQMELIEGMRTPKRRHVFTITEKGHAFKDIVISAKKK